MNIEVSSKTRNLIVMCVFSIVFSFALAGQGLCLPPIIMGILQYEQPNEGEDSIESQAATIQSFANAIVPVLCFFTLPSLGGLTDRFGRKFLIVVSSGALGVSMVLLLLAYYLKIMWLMYASVVFMFCEGTGQVSGMAYINDISDTDTEKSRNFGLIIGMSMIGIIAGSFGIGFLAGINQAIALYTLAGVCIVCTIALGVVFREEKKEDKEKSSTVNPFRALKLLFVISPVVTCIVISYALFAFAQSDGNSDYIYTQHRYNWGPQENGIQGAVSGVSTIVWQLLGLRILVKYVAEEWLLSAFLLLSVVVNVLSGLATKGLEFMLISVFGGFVTLCIPLIETLVSKNIDQSEQGVLFGGLVSINLISQFLGDLALENAFALCLKGEGYFSCPGASFYIGAVLLFIATVVSFTAFIRNPPLPNTYTPLPTFTDPLNLNE